MSSLLRLAVVMDYQNIHLTARDLFAPVGTPAHEVLISPALFGEQLVEARNRNSPPESQAELADVFVFRGAPTNNHQPDLYKITQAQKSEWTRDRRVHVTYRSLRYHPGKPTQEKGVDVLVALNFVRLVQEHQHDVVVLAAHDTDLEPALEMAAGFTTGAKPETAGWATGRRLRAAGKQLWHTSLDGPAMIHSRDRKDYSVHI